MLTHVQEPNTYFSKFQKNVIATLKLRNLSCLCINEFLPIRVQSYKTLIAIYNIKSRTLGNFLFGMTLES